MNVDDLALALGVGSARGARALARAVGSNGARASNDGKLTVVALGEAVARALEQAGHVALRARFERGRLALEDGSADAHHARALFDELGRDRQVRKARR